MSDYEISNTVNTDFNYIFKVLLYSSKAKKLCWCVNDYFTALFPRPVREGSQLALFHNGCFQTFINSTFVQFHCCLRLFHTFPYKGEMQISTKIKNDIMCFEGSWIIEKGTENNAVLRELIETIFCECNQNGQFVCVQKHIPVGDISSYVQRPNSSAKRIFYYSDKNIRQNEILELTHILLQSFV